MFISGSRVKPFLYYKDDWQIFLWDLKQNHKLNQQMQKYGSQNTIPHYQLDGYDFTWLICFENPLDHWVFSSCPKQSHANYKLEHGRKVYIKKKPHKNS